jgi:hypothetical protein
MVPRISRAILKRSSSWGPESVGKYRVHRIFFAGFADPFILFLLWRYPFSPDFQCFV